MGIFKLIGLKISDAYWQNTHQIQVWEAAGLDANLRGYFINWGQVWKPSGAPVAMSNNWYGPYPADPLVR